jgi:hypothetical protein
MVEEKGQPSLSAIDQYLERVAKDIKRELDRELESCVKVAEQRYMETVERLKEASRIIMPINLLEILSKGGYIFSKIYECIEEKTYVYLYNMDVDFLIPRLEKGKYRITVIIEKLEEEERSVK